MMEGTDDRDESPSVQQKSANRECIFVCSGFLLALLAARIQE
jgi:hypothetical protein